MVASAAAVQSRKVLADHRAPGQGRSLVIETLTRWGFTPSDEMVEALVLAVSEVMTNAQKEQVLPGVKRHTLVIRIYRRSSSPTRVRVQVEDRNQGRPVPKDGPPPVISSDDAKAFQAAPEGGWGLWLTENIVFEVNGVLMHFVWGSDDRKGGGNVVWVEGPVPVAA